MPKTCRAFPSHATMQGMSWPHQPTLLCAHISMFPRPSACSGAGSPLPVYPVQEEFTASSPPLVSWEETETEPLGAGLGLCQKLMNPVRRMIQMEKFDTGDLSTEQGVDQESPSCPSPGPWYPASRDHSFWHKDSTGHAVLRC